jgi:WD40 repeat protein
MPRSTAPPFDADVAALLGGRSAAASIRSGTRTLAAPGPPPPLSPPPLPGPGHSPSPSTTHPPHHESVLSPHHRTVLPPATPASPSPAPATAAAAAAARTWRPEPSSRLTLPALPSRTRVAGVAGVSPGSPVLWSRDGDELVYTAGSFVVACRVGPAPSLLLGRQRLISDDDPLSDVGCVALSPDGRFLATAEMGPDPVICLFDFVDGSLLHRWRAVADGEGPPPPSPSPSSSCPPAHGLAGGIPPGCLSFSSDATLLVAAGLDARGAQAVSVLAVPGTERIVGRSPTGWGHRHASSAHAHHRNPPAASASCSCVDWRGCGASLYPVTVGPIRGLQCSPYDPTEFATFGAGGVTLWDVRLREGADAAGEKGPKAEASLGSAGDDDSLGSRTASVAEKAPAPVPVPPPSSPPAGERDVPLCRALLHGHPVPGLPASAGITALAFEPEATAALADALRRGDKGSARGAAASSRLTAVEHWVAEGFLDGAGDAGPTSTLYPPLSLEVLPNRPTAGLLPSALAAAARGAALGGRGDSEESRRPQSDARQRLFAATDAGTVHQIGLGGSGDGFIGATAATENGDDNDALSAQPGRPRHGPGDVEGGFRLHDRGSASASGGGVAAFAVSPSLCASAGAADGRVRVWPADLRECVWEAAVGLPVSGLAIRPGTTADTDVIAIQCRRGAGTGDGGGGGLAAARARVDADGRRVGTARPTPSALPAVLLLMPGRATLVHVAGGHAGDVAAVTARTDAEFGWALVGESGGSGRRMGPQVFSAPAVVGDGDAPGFLRWECGEDDDGDRLEEDEEGGDVGRAPTSHWRPTLPRGLLHHANDALSTAFPVPVTSLAVRTSVELGVVDAASVVSSREFALSLSGYGSRGGSPLLPPPASASAALLTSTTTDVVCGMEDGSLRVFDAQTGLARHAVPRVHEADTPVAALAVAPDGRTVVSASCDGRVAFYAAFAGYRPLRLFAPSPFPRHAGAVVLAVSPRGSLIAVGLGGCEQDGEREKGEGGGGVDRSHSRHPSGGEALSAVRRPQVLIIRTADASLAARIELPPALDAPVEGVESGDGPSPPLLPPSCVPTSLLFLQDGGDLLVGTHDGRLLLYAPLPADWLSGAHPARRPHPHAHVPGTPVTPHAVACAPAPALLATLKLPRKFLPTGDGTGSVCEPGPGQGWPAIAALERVVLPSSAAAATAAEAAESAPALVCVSGEGVVACLRVSDLYLADAAPFTTVDIVGPGGLVEGGAEASLRLPWPLASPVVSAAVLRVDNPPPGRQTPDAEPPRGTCIRLAVLQEASCVWTEADVEVW